MHDTTPTPCCRCKPEDPLRHSEGEVDVKITLALDQVMVDDLTG